MTDLRQAARALARSPGFTLAAALTLAIGIGATTTVFSLVNAILLEPLPYRHADRLVAVGHTAPGLELGSTGMSDGTYLHYRAHSRALEEIATWYENVANVSGGGDAERVPVAMVSHTFFTVLDARTTLGRLPTPGDADGSGEVVVLISHDLWQRRYGSDPDIIGTTIEANRVPRRVIGVMEPGFDFPRREIGIWYPTDPDPAEARASDLYQHGIARLRRGVNAAAAERELNRLIASLPDAFPDMTRQLLADARLRAQVTPLRDAVVGEASAALWLLLGGMAFLLLIACANVANLCLVRGEYRQKEIAVRTALGADRLRLARLFGAESLILVALGAAAGVFVADAGVQALVAYGPANLPRLHDVAIDARVLGFVAVLSLVIALLFAFPPLFRYAGVDVARALKESGFGITAGVSGQRARRLLITGQVALALTLLVGSALLAQSFWRLKRAHPGFNADGVLTAEIAVPRSGYESYDQARRLWDGLLTQVRALPGVEGAAAVSGLPLVPQPAYYDVAFDVAGRPAESRQAITMYHASISYFETMHIPVVEGTGLAAATRAVERPVLLSAAAARRLFPGESAVGKRLRRGVGSERPWATVAGVVGDVPKQRVGGEPAEIVYVPMLENAVDPGIMPSHSVLVVRASVPPATLTPAVRRIVRELDPHLPVANVRTMERIVADSMARTSFTMLLLIIAAAAALFLGGIGLYGVISYVVSRRTHELGIRIALGARTADVRNLVVREGARFALGGIALGVIAALALTRLLRGLLYQVSPTDPVTLVAMVVLLLGVTLFASWLPARRAAAIEPLRALRTE
jgi:putative ABC transport system permease protein